MTIRVVARAVARPQTRAALQAALTAMLAPTRQEPGCLRYELTVNTANPDEFVMLEEWRSEADMQRHLQTPHVAELLAKAPALVAAPPDIRSYRVLG